MLNLTVFNWAISIDIGDARAALYALLGGLLIGWASYLLLASIGRVAGVSSIVAGAIKPSSESLMDDAPVTVKKDGHAWRVAFLLGLVLGGYAMVQYLELPSMKARPIWVLMTAGLLVGFGTVLGSGCTSGHGVCGLGRRSLRSLMATLIFMATGFATVCVVYMLTGKAML
jgi:uncharacterized protein